MKKTRSYEEQVMNSCLHFTGLFRQTHCKAGVCYDEVKDTSTRPYRFPCFADNGISRTCPHAQFPTAEEAAAEKRRSDERHARVSKARAAIVEHTIGKRGVAGTIPCPCCEGGTLRFSVSGYNGHIHARCSTEGCAWWME